MGSVIQRAREVFDDADLVQSASGIWCPSVQGPGGLTLRDRIGVNDGTLTNMSVADWIDRALSFGGTNEYVLVSSVFGLGNTSSTIGVWVDLDSTSESGSFVKVGSGTTGFAIGVGGTNYDNVGNNLILLYENKRWISTSTAIGTGWHHVTMTIDSTGVPSAYLDGEFIASYGGTNAFAPTLSTNIGGYDPSASPRYTDVHIDDVRIYPLALKPQQIKRLYSGGQGRGIGLRPSHYEYEPIRVNYDADLVQSATGIWCPSVQGPGGLTLRDLRRVNNAALTSTTWENDHGISLSLNGTTSYGVIENYDDHVATMALSAWVKADTLVTWGTIAKLWPNTASLDKFHFGIQASDGDLSIYIRQDDNTQLGPVREGAGMPLPTGSWHHVAFVCDGAFIRLYRDGNEVGTAISYDGTMNAGSDFIGLGAKVDSSGTPVSPGGSPGYWDGMIDDVRVFPMLTSQQIRRLYSGGQGRGIGLGPDSLVSPFTTQWGSVAAAEAAAFQAAWGASATTIAGVASGQ